MLGAANVAAIGAALVQPGQASANYDEPWPEPPSCSNVTGSCSSMEDLVAYECYFETDPSPFNFCDDPFAGLWEQDTNSFAAPHGEPDPTPTRVVAPATRG